MSNNKTTYKRYHILALVFGSVIVNYLDRSNLAVAAIGFKGDLDLSNAQMGYIFSAFGLTYAILQVPGGIFADRIKPRLLYSIMLALWSIATLLQGLANSFIILLGLRGAIGIFEAPSFPLNNAIVTRWFPTKERASAIAIYTSGQYVGLAFLTPVLFAIQDTWGWRGLFVVSGLVGMLWAVVWYVFYRDPLDHKKVSATELDHIKKGDGLITSVGKETSQKMDWDGLGQVLLSRKLLGIYIGQFCIGSMVIFFLTWFPTYLVEYRGLGFLKSGILASIPYLAAWAGVLLSGFFSDLFMRRGFSNEFARKAPVISGMLLSAIIIGANYTNNTDFIILFLALAFFGNGFSSITWVFVSTLAPKKFIGLVGGIFNSMGSASAVIIPALIGHIVKEDDFSPALFLMGGIAVVGFLSYIFLVGKVERIEIQDKR